MRPIHQIGQPRAPMAVTAKTRKRCPICDRMVEVGEPAILTDDRYIAENISRNHGGRQYRASRGAFHLYHPPCRERFEASVRELTERNAQQQEER